MAPTIDVEYRSNCELKLEWCDRNKGYALAAAELVALYPHGAPFVDTGVTITPVNCRCDIIGSDDMEQRKISVYEAGYTPNLRGDVKVNVSNFSSERQYVKYGDIMGYLIVNGGVKANINVIG